MSKIFNPKNETHSLSLCDVCGNTFLCSLGCSTKDKECPADHFILHCCNNFILFHRSAMFVRPSGKIHQAPRSICRSCRFVFFLSIDTNGVGDNKGRDITNVEVDNKEFNFTHVLDKVKAKLRDVTRVVSPTIVKLATLDQHQQGGGQMRGQRTVAI